MVAHPTETALEYPDKMDSINNPTTNLVNQTR